MGSFWFHNITNVRLAGPLHGLAAQDVLRFVLDMQKEVGLDPSEDTIRDFLWKTLKSGQVIPGYGHGVLRQPDPRFRALNDFGNRRPKIAQDKTFRLVHQISQIAPGVLREHGKTKNPQYYTHISLRSFANDSPNVDAQSGVLFYNLGLQDFKYYTVIFGVSRAIGCMAQLVWDRALGLPIERPKSVSLQVIQSLVEKQ
jgi:citrate synthase